MQVLLDTHVWAWTLIETDQISAPARQAIDDAEQVWLSPFSAFEIAQKVRLGKWDRMAAVVGRVGQILQDQGVTLAPTDLVTLERAGMLNWDHRDPFDRIIAATALVLGVPVVTRDRALHAFDDIHCIW